MNKTQITKYEKRFNRILSHLKSSQKQLNPHVQRQLIVVKENLKKINQKNLPNESKKLRQKQLDLILHQLEQKLVT